MKCRVQSIDTEREYGSRKEIAEHDIGPIYVNEMYLGSIQELQRLLKNEDVESIELSEDSLSKYDALLTIAGKDSSFETFK